MRITILVATAVAFLCGPARAQINFDSSSGRVLADIIGSQNLNIPASVAEPLQEKALNSCEGYPLTMRLRGRSVTLPAEGVWNLESHLATNDDYFSGRRLFPSSVHEKIAEHIANSCALLAKFAPGIKCGEVYSTRWDKEWTPPENGKAGQGTLGNIKPSKEEEIWIFNMMWLDESMPKPGTKFLASCNGKDVVVVGGYERGPSSRKFLGGFQREVLWYLGAEEGSSRITISSLRDQSLPPGPINCAQR